MLDPTSSSHFIKPILWKSGRSDELFSPPRAGSIAFTLTAFHNATVYDLKGSIRAPREDLSRALLLTCVFTKMWWRFAHATPFTLDPWTLLGVLSSMFQGFEVKSGGELRASLEEAEGIPSTALLIIDLKTPRVVRKGATTPADTLKALSNMTVILLRAPALGNVTLSVFLEEGVKVKLNGVEVKEVALKDVSALKVALATALTMSAEPSIVDAGGEVVVRGRIAVDPKVLAGKRS